MGRHAEALPHYDEALRLNPDYAEAHAGKADCLAGMGRHAGALPHYDEALRLNPDYDEARMAKGGCLADLGRYDEALRTMLAENDRKHLVYPEV